MCIVLRELLHIGPLPQPEKTPRGELHGSHDAHNAAVRRVEGDQCWAHPPDLGCRGDRPHQGRGGPNLSQVEARGGPTAVPSSWKSVPAYLYRSIRAGLTPFSSFIRSAERTGGFPSPSTAFACATGPRADFLFLKGPSCCPPQGCRGPLSFDEPPDWGSNWLWLKG